MNAYDGGGCRGLEAKKKGRSRYHMRSFYLAV
jgi:hypothetical protein